MMFNKEIHFEKKSKEYQKLAYAYGNLKSALDYLKEVEQDVDFEESKIRECIKILDSIK